MSSFTQFIACKGTLTNVSVPRVMGIVNVTPDSFYAQSRVSKAKELLRKVEEMLRRGADFIDVGGYSSRPGAADVSPDEEMRRVIPAIESIHRNFPEAKISVDTFRARVADTAVQAGACMINDISGGHADPEMLDVVAKHQVPYIVMHMRGNPRTMQKLTGYSLDIVTEVNRFFAASIQRLHRKNINDIIIDPGFGFAKTLEQNYMMLKHLDRFLLHRKLVLVGMSRKSMLYKLLQTDQNEALNATTAVHILALLKGASVLRVHDVKEAKEAIRIVSYMDGITKNRL